MPSFSKIILLSVGRNENKNGSPIINLQYFDLIMFSRDSGRYRNQGNANRIKRLLHNEKILLKPSRKTGLPSAISEKYTSKSPEKLQHNTDSANQTWPKSFCFFPIYHQMENKAAKANRHVLNCHQP